MTIRLSHLIAGAALALSIALLFASPPDGMPLAAMRAASAVALAIGLWSTGVLPEYFVSIIFFVVVILIGAAPPNVAFSGLYSNAAWLVYGGLVVGVAIHQTGFGARMARTLVGYLASSYLGVLFGVVLVVALLAFIMPSAAGRVLIMMPIVLALADRLGLGEGSNGRVGMALALATGTVFPTFGILPAAVPNLGLAGAAQSIYGVTLTYGDYLAALFPVIGIASIIALPVMIRFLYPATLQPVTDEAEPSHMSGTEWRMLAILLVMLGLWLTDFAHGISPAWIAVAGAIVLMLPGIGVIPPTVLVQKINYGPFFFVSGLIGMGAVVHHSGLGTQIGQLLFSLVDIGAGGFQSFLSVIGIGMGMGAVATMPGQPAIMTPLAQTIADATGWPLETVLMAQAPSWMLLIGPYEIPPLVVALGLAGITIGQTIRLVWAFTLFAWLVIVPLLYLWWRLIGLLPG